MDFQNNNNDISDAVPPQQPPAQGPGYIPPGVQGARPAPARRKGSGWRIFFGVVLVLSIIANIVLFLALVGVAAFVMTGHTGLLTEEVLRAGPASSKIAVVSVQGLIQAELASSVYNQLKAAADDSNVKGVILRVNSPGGTISGSDRIYNEVLRFRKETGKPIVGLMQGVAASGGYYVSVACEKIMAEPTTITGSIGVLSWYLVVQDLLKDKLGIEPVTVKSGTRKDWPSSFRKPAPEELKYIEDKVITPAYNRFLKVVAEGRRELLGAEEVEKLADGSIFWAEEALEEKLIDGIGYLDDAVALVKSMAGLTEARVVQYRRPFSLARFMGYGKQNTLKIDKNTLYELATPEIMYLWSAY